MTTNSLTLLMKVARHRFIGSLTGHRPFILSHLITGECNFYCKPCLWKHNEMPVLSIEEIRSLYSQARECGFVANYLWGGEPLMRTDVGEIVRSSKENGFITLINTNVWYLPEKIEAIHPYVDGFIISLDHPRAEGHDAIRGVKGAYDRVLESIRLIRREYPSIKIFVNSLAMKSNREEIREILEIWKNLGIWGYVNFIETDLRESGGMKNRKANIDVDEHTRRELARFMISAKEGGYPVLNTKKYYRTFLDGKKKYRCHFPKMFLEVYADGSVLDCVRVDQPVGNVKDAPLRELLAHPRIRGMIADGETWCNVHNNADRIDSSLTWELHPEAVANLLRFL